MTVSCALCCSEGNSLFSFQQCDIDVTLYFCDEFLRPKSFAAHYAIHKGVPTCILALCVSDSNKELLLRSDYVSPYCSDPNNMRIFALTTDSEQRPLSQLSASVPGWGWAVSVHRASDRRAVAER